ncbi:MAG: DUF4352 domain-containing protein [Coriobacteriia bacterium]|nr:DUF4352 domain-containing protein [Coriobacteriia bacterium]MCL2745600.1 DUF4352 domain-containing protein [Coriobacteriia bacterium]MCL2871321.1 DUF4352 domain-containing protein [Coriobacteriia bacterium]
MLLLAALLVLSVGALVGCDDSGPTVVETPPETTEVEEIIEEEPDFTNLPVGTVVDLDGLQVAVTEVKAGPESWGGNPTTEVVVTFTNESDTTSSFNPWDWQVENTSGVRSNDALTDADSLNSGDLAPGGSVTGSMFFEVSLDEAASVVFTPDFWGGDDSLIFWTVGE